MLFSCFKSPLSVTSLMPETLHTSLWVLGEPLFCQRREVRVELHGSHSLVVIRDI